MERESRADFVSPEVSQTSADADRTLASPVFDENSIHHARPAVPLQNTARAARLEGGWSPSLIALAVAAGIVGGIIGIFAINFYQHRAAPSSPAQVSATTSASNEQIAPANVATKNDTSATTTTTTNTRAIEQMTQVPVATSNASSSVAASPASRNDQTANSDQSAKNDQTASARGGDEQELRAALDEWIAATNARDIDRQMKFYEPTVAAFYLTRNASRQAVRAEKSNVFARASTVDVRADEPQISLSPDRATATMRFRKQYAIMGGGSDRRGAVIQELRWRRTGAGWRITSERDLRVVN
jgi:ketosteroid isomerase-like protein